MDVYSLGNEVSFELHKDGDTVDLPASYWLAIDQGGELWRRCDVMVLPVASKAQGRGVLPFYGHLGGSGPVAFHLPPSGGWRRVGQVDQVLYTRPDQGPKFHLFERGHRIELYSHPSRRAWRLVLPDGCKVNHLGFEWP